MPVTCAISSNGFRHESLPDSWAAAVTEPDETSAHVADAFANGSLTIEWRKAGETRFRLLHDSDALIPRGASPVDVEFRVTMQASASHLRSAIMTTVDCGCGRFTLLSGTTEHWHISNRSETEILQAIYRLPAKAMQGIYGFAGEVSGRALHEQAQESDASHATAPAAWHYDPTDLHRYPSRFFSISDTD